MSKKPNIIFEHIEKYELELGNLIEKANNFIDCKGLVLTKNECERDILDDKNNQTTLLKIKNKLNTMNKKRSEIEDKWKAINEDILLMHEQMTAIEGKLFYRQCRQ